MGCRDIMRRYNGIAFCDLEYSGATRTPVIMLHINKLWNAAISSAHTLAMRMEISLNTHSEIGCVVAETTVCAFETCQRITLFRHKKTRLNTYKNKRQAP